ncbi:LCP family protein [Aerococcaceae bacterium NML201209]|nr:LCP family protein [Aerococcaceae bacterium NML201209]
MIKKIKLLVCALVMLFGAVTSLGAVHAQESEKFNFLFLGVDAGYEADRLEELEGSRSDAIMILTFDKGANTLTISTIPRDSLVEIPGHGVDKVNHAFAFGGVDLTIQTLEQWLGIKFDNYVVSNMPGFIKIIDFFNGIDVVPPTTFNWEGQFFFEKDVPQHIDGRHALGYARERFTSGGDYARQARMREMMKVILQRLISEGSMEQYREAFDKRYEHILTNISFDELLALYEEYAHPGLNITEFQLKGRGYTDEKLGYVDETNPESLEELLNILK